MRFTNIASAAALAVALGFSGSAYAQTIVGGVNVTDIDLPRVQEMCDRMGDETATTLNEADSETAEQNAQVDSNTSPSIDDITVQDCIDAGLLPEGTPIPEVEGATTD